MPITDLTGTKWVINSIPSVNLEQSFSLTFTSNSSNWSTLQLSYGNDPTIKYTFGTWVYSNDTWTDQDYRLISITGGDDAQNSTLISWLQDNAVQAPVVDLSGTTWDFNDTITTWLSNDGWHNLIFTSNNYNCTSMYVGTSEYPWIHYASTGIFEEYGTERVYNGNSSGWSIVNVAFKSISITGGTDASNPSLIAWLSQNATYSPPPSKVSIDISTMEGWSSVSTGRHTLTLKAMADGYRDSEFSQGIEAKKIIPIKCTVSNLGSSSPSSVTFTKDANFTKIGLGIEEVTYNSDTFIKIPTMYRKVNTVTSNQITSFTIANTDIDNDYKPYPCFIDENGNLLDYILIGKYWNTSSNSCISRTSGAGVGMGLSTARAYARARGTGYQLFDWQMQILWRDLLICFMQTVNTNNGSGITTDSLGFYWSSGETFIDGVIGTNSSWAICYKPSLYTSLSGSTSSIPSNYTTVSYSQPSGVREVSKIGYDSSHPFFNYPSAQVSNSSYNTYYCDRHWYGEYSKPVTLYVGASDSADGAFNGGTVNGWDTTFTVFRLCYRPISS